MSASLPGNRELPASQYDLSTYWGRVRHSADISDPRTLFVSTKGLEHAKAMVASYKQGKIGEMNPELWNAKKIVDSTLHPGMFIRKPHSCKINWRNLDTGKPTIGTLLWQITNQSLNVAINNANANKSTPLSVSKITQSYFLAVGASCSVALGLNALVPRLKSVSPATKTTLTRLVPFAAVASAGALNVFLMRGEEIRQGIDIYPVLSQSEKEKLASEGKSESSIPSLGKSKKAATLAVSETALSRVLNSSPIMVIPPLILVRLQKQEWLKRNPRLTLPLNLGLILGTSLFALPLALAAFPQRQSVDASSLEEEFWASFENESYLYPEKSVLKCSKVYLISIRGGYVDRVLGHCWTDKAGLLVHEMPHFTIEFSRRPVDDPFVPAPSSSSKGGVGVGIRAWCGAVRDSGYRSSNLVNGASRLGAAYNLPTPPSNSTSANGIGVAEPPRVLENVDHSTRSEEEPTIMPVSSTSAKTNSKKRQRSKEPREPDWHKFYKNGLPKEIIVIEDSPSPKLSVSVISNAQANRTVASGNNRHAAKKRKRNDGASTYDSVYEPGPPHSTDQSPQHKDSTSGSTISTDRTTSAIHTTAATSLGSHSSNGQNGFEVAEVQPGQKRKRTATRLQIANEAKRKELEVNGDAYSNYVPPPRPPIKAPDVQTSPTKNTKVDDDDGHYIVVPDTDLTERCKLPYVPWKAQNKLVAIKIIRSVQKYRDASRIELRVLSTLKANDHENRNRCIHLRDCFDYRGHICIVMDLLGQSVFDFLKGNSFVPFPNSQIQSFARQLFTSVAFLHDLNLIHTDLKPENILLCDSSYQAFTYSRRIPSSSTTINRQAAQRKVLLDTEIRLIDFGSATFQDEYHSSVVSTRHYRAPEIILGLGWSFPCDIWSIGCILVEFFTGDALFQTHDNLEHLAMMESVCGGRFDTHLIQQVNNMAKRSGGNQASRFFKRLKLDYPQQDTTRASRRFVKAMKRLEDIIPDNSNHNQNKFCKNFLDLLRKIFVYDPADRITAKEALQHPWFKEAATPDDGTEAARIRLQRQRQAAVDEAAALRLNGYHQ
ncbi:hypothetical protein B7494_g3806 [Chlorociboria aeruginascens]|nr:hypothetical protein B7494_g3806 [Chlorociboria aeruginascens]